MSKNWKVWYYWSLVKFKQLPEARRWNLQIQKSWSEFEQFWCFALIQFNCRFFSSKLQLYLKIHFTHYRSKLQYVHESCKQFSSVFINVKFIPCLLKKKICKDCNASSSFDTVLTFMITPKSVVRWTSICPNQLSLNDCSTFK